MMRTRAAAGLLAITLPLAACSGSDDSDSSDLAKSSSSEILTEAKAALADAETVSVEGSGAGDGASIELDLSFVGDDTAGSVSLDGATIKLLRVDEKSYVQIAPEALKALGAGPEEIAKLGTGKWILAAAGDQNFAQFAALASRKDFFDNLLDPDSEPTKTKVTEMDGVDVIGLKSTTGTLYVSVDDARPVSLKRDGDSRALTFDYDDEDAPEAPPADQVVDSSELS